MIGLYTDQRINGIAMYASQFYVAPLATLPGHTVVGLPRVRLVVGLARVRSVIGKPA